MTIGILTGKEWIRQHNVLEMVKKHNARVRETGKGKYLYAWEELAKVTMWPKKNRPWLDFSTGVVLGFVLGTIAGSTIAFYVL